MKINLIEKAVGSGLYTGFIPIASGTFGSMIGLLIYAIPGFENPLIIIPAILIFSLWGKIIGDKFDMVYGKDPSECTIDEVVGMWISLLFLPKTLVISIVAFLSWRIFDIVKPWPARKLEKLKGGTGIMIDDIVAGFYSMLFIHLILLIFNYN